MNEEKLAIRKLEEFAKDYNRRGAELHYSLILHNLIINLQEENKQLQERLDKAIKYIEDGYLINTKELKEILRGDDNE